MLAFSYLAMIIFTIIGSFWLEFFLKVRVFARFKRVIQAIAPIAFLFLAWDAYAVRSGHWRFDRAQILGVYGPFSIPLEEYLFFLVVPVAAILTIEAVRKVKKNWRI